MIIFSVVFANFSQIFAQTTEFSGAKIVTNGEAIIVNRQIELMKRTMGSRFFPFLYTGLSIFLDANQKEPRGQLRGKEMKLSAQVTNDTEFIKLFTHELAHVVDIYFLRATQNFPDPSKDFYKISWQSMKTKHAGTSLSDFVSGYAATNQYEDFAESFVWYVFHNNNFLDRAMKNESLRQKYLFFADNVFVHGEFQGTDFSLTQAPDYLWDTTKIPILFQNYLNFLG